MKQALMVLALFFGAPVLAQNVTYSNAETKACLATVPQGGDAMACAGLSAQTCMNTTAGGYSTVMMTSCLDRELTFWDDLLNANYRAALARAEQADAGNAGFTAPSQAKALREMQRAWIPFRDAACNYARSQWGGGTGGGPAALACLMDRTARQAILLGERFGN